MSFGLLRISEYFGPALTEELEVGVHKCPAVELEI
jgi:hypothetical protein